MGMGRLEDPVLGGADDELVAAIRQRRGGTLLALDQMLLHAPPFARGWNALLGAVRGELTLPARLRELVICSVAVINRAPFELAQHAPIYLKAGGSQSVLDDLGGEVPPTDDPTERAVLALTDAMTRDVEVPQPVFDAAREALGDDRQLVELIAVVATYNMVSRFLCALEI